MKKNEVNESANQVNNNEVTVTKEQFINANFHYVPKNRKNKFMSMTIDEQYDKLHYYIERQRQIEAYREKSKFVNRVKALFETKHATVEDAQEVMEFCQEFLNNYKQAEIDKLDAEIARLMVMKKSLED